MDDNEPTSSDPAVIRSVAVSPDDLVDAFVYSRENPATAVLRLTPPFHGRMRARLHVSHRNDADDDAAQTGALHLEPDSLLSTETVQSYPDLESTLADEPDSTTTDRIRRMHADAVDRWRERARNSLREAVSIAIDDGHHEIELKRLG